RLWMSDKQDAFVTAIASVCPDTPHRYCGNHFLRDLAKPVLELDSHAKVQMRSKIRGLRAIEREVLQERAAAQPVPDGRPKRSATTAVPAANGMDVVLDYCAAVRGIINDSQGGRCVRQVCGCRKRWAKCVDRWGVTSDSKKGTRGSAARTIGGLYRPGKKLGRGDAQTSGRVCRDDS